MISPEDLADLTEFDEDGGWPSMWVAPADAWLPQLPAVTDAEREWKANAACAGKLDWFTMDEPNSWELRRAQEICSACPVFDECRALADDIEGNRRPEYLACIYAGESGLQRHNRRNGVGGGEPKPGTWNGRRDVTHGTNACYVYGCRQFECVDAHRIYQADYRERRRASATGSTKRRTKHATDACYAGGCRRPSCKAAHSRALREYRSKKRAEGAA